MIILQDYINLEIKKKSGLSLNPDIHHSKVFSSDYMPIILKTLQIVQVFKTGEFDEL